MTRIYNFAAGPAMLPLEVLLEAKENIVEWQNMGISQIECSHVTDEYKALANDTYQRLRQILDIPADYEIISMHGGARTQFAAVPLNLASETKQANYLVSGTWSQQAYLEAKNMIAPHISQIINADFSWQQISEPSGYQPSYLHYTPNETVQGISIAPPKTDLPLVADATSALLGMKFDIKQHALIYAAAQKNIGIPGITFVILQKSLLKPSIPGTPTIMQYTKQVEKNSLYNTPTTFAMYIANLMLKWQQKQEDLMRRNLERSKMVYDLLEQHDCYTNLVPRELRSPLNITFNITQDTDKFLADAKAAGLHSLKGHKIFGGIRASLYNGMPNSGVTCLLEFLDKFAKKL